MTELSMLSEMALKAELETLKAKIASGVMGVHIVLGRRFLAVAAPRRTRRTRRAAH